MIKFRRQFAGSYFAYDETRQYAVYGGSGCWGLKITKLVEVAGAKTPVGQDALHQVAGYDTKAEAVAVAKAYHELTDDYSGYPGRFRQAYLNVYEARSNAVNAELDAQRKLHATDAALQWALEGRS